MKTVKRQRIMLRAVKIARMKLANIYYQKVEKKLILNKVKKIGIDLGGSTN